MSARVAMLRMQDDGLISLPAPRRTRPDPTVQLTDRTAPGTPIERPAGALRPLTLQRVQCKPDSQLWVDICSCDIDIHHIHVAQRVY